MGPYLGDFLPGQIVRHLWDSNGADGASITRATNGTISVYKDHNVAQSTTGITDTEDFDGVTGVHAVAVDLSSDVTFYSFGSEFHIVLSSATIDGKTVNSVLGSFSIGRDFPKFGIIDAGIAQAAASPTSYQIRAGAAFADDELIGSILFNWKSSAGSGQSRLVRDNTGSSDTLTVDGFTTTPTGTRQYLLYGTPPNADIDVSADTIEKLATMIEGAGPFNFKAAALALGPAGATEYKTTGIADSGSTTSMVDAARTEADGYFDGWKLRATSGPIAGQERKVKTFAGGTFQWTRQTSAAWSTNNYELRPDVDAILDGSTHTGAVLPLVSSVSGAVTVATVNDKTGYSLSNSGIDALLDRPIAEPATPFAWDAASLRKIIQFVGVASLNKTISAETNVRIRNSADSGDIATATQGVLNGVYTRGKFA